jgi:hypothetical protein
MFARAFFLQSRGSTELSDRVVASLYRLGKFLSAILGET